MRHFHNWMLESVSNITVKSLEGEGEANWLAKNNSYRIHECCRINSASKLKVDLNSRHEYMNNIQVHNLTLVSCAEDWGLLHASNWYLPSPGTQFVQVLDGTQKEKPHHIHQGQVSYSASWQTLTQALVGNKWTISSNRRVPWCLADLLQLKVNSYTGKKSCLQAPRTKRFCLYSRNTGLLKYM